MQHNHNIAASKNEEKLNIPASMLFTYSQNQVFFLVKIAIVTSPTYDYPSNSHVCPSQGFARAVKSIRRAQLCTYDDVEDQM